MNFQSALSESKVFMQNPDVDECKERLACQCDGCSCKNTWGGYQCKCSGNRVYMKDQDTCIGKHVPSFSFILIENHELRNNLEHDLCL